MSNEYLQNILQSQFVEIHFKDEAQVIKGKDLICNGQIILSIKAHIIVATCCGSFLEKEEDKVKQFS